MTLGQLITFEAMKSTVSVPCAIDDGGASAHHTEKYVFVRILPKSRVDQPNAEGVGFGQNTERSMAEVKLCPDCFAQLLYKMTQAAKEAQFVV